MLRLNRFLPKTKVLGLCLLSACCWLTAYAAETRLSAFAGGIRPDAIWRDPDFFNLVSACRTDNPCQEGADPQQCTAAVNNCLAQKMRAKGAGIQAIAFTQYAPVPSTIDEFERYGKVAVAHARMQWADASDGFFLITAQGVIVPVSVEQVTFQQDFRYRAFLRRFPKALLASGPGNLTWPRVLTKVNQGQQFVFAFPLLDGCMACRKIGTARIAFLFNNAGNFLGKRLVDVTSTPPPTPAALSKPKS